MLLQRVIDFQYSWIVKERNLIMRLILTVNWIVFGALLVGSYATAMQNSYEIPFYHLARESGEYAALLFILVSIPGIARRFRFSHKLIMIVMMFRRQLGVLMYLFVLMHALILRIIPWLTKEIPLVVEPFVLAGILANILLFTLFITSNDWSVKRLGTWWGKIHDLIYIIVWIIFIHLALQGIGKWTIIVGATAVLQLTSHLFAQWKKKSLN